MRYRITKTTMEVYAAWPRQNDEEPPPNVPTIDIDPAFFNEYEDVEAMYWAMQAVLRMTEEAWNANQSRGDKPVEESWNASQPHGDQPASSD